MDWRVQDLTGQKFGKLTVVSYIGKIHETKHSETYWMCLCECGNKKAIRRDKLIQGITKSCGCIKTGRKVLHGESKTRLYRIYDHMRRRCENTKSHAYKNYGGRGIKVCKEWRESFLEFSKWAKAAGYTDTLTIDRINVNGNYEPSNCRWVGCKEQANNKRDTIYLVYKGQKVSITNLAEELNVPRHIIYKKVRKGWDSQKIINSIIGEREFIK